MNRQNVLILVPRPDLKKIRHYSHSYFYPVNEKIFHQTLDESKQYIMNEFILSSYRNKIQKLIIKKYIF